MLNENKIDFLVYTVQETHKVQVYRGTEGAEVIRAVRKSSKEDGFVYGFVEASKDGELVRKYKYIMPSGGVEPHVTVEYNVDRLDNPKEVDFGGYQFASKVTLVGIAYHQNYTETVYVGDNEDEIITRLRELYKHAPEFNIGRIEMWNSGKLKCSYEVKFHDEELGDISDDPVLVLDTDTFPRTYR
ncbi:hypothetical protein [Bacillus sp. NEAU-Y102]